MRVLVIGYGSMGKRHAANAQTLGHEVGVRDVDIDRVHLAKANGYWTDGSGAPRFRPDAVIIASPVATHSRNASLVRRDLPPLPLFVEKPLATDMNAASVFAEWPHPTTMVGYNLRWQPRARELIGAIKPAKFVDCRLDCDMSKWPGRDYGDFLLECSHEIDLALACGASNNVSRATLGVQQADIWLGSSGRVRINAASRKYFREWGGLGERFGYKWRFDEPSELGEQMYRDELAHFLACAQAGVATECPFANGLAVLRICEQAKAMAGVMR